MSAIVVQEHFSFVQRNYRRYGVACAYWFASGRRFGRKTHTRQDMPFLDGEFIECEALDLLESLDSESAIRSGCGHYKIMPCVWWLASA